MKKYMVIASFLNNENDNLEVVNFDLTREEACLIVKDLNDESDCERAFICEHSDFEYV